VSQIFKEQENFLGLEVLYLERYCEMTKFLTQMIGKYRPELLIKFNSNLSALTYEMQIESDDDDLRTKD